MRKVVPRAGVAIVVTLASIDAQLLPPDDTGMTMGHVLLNVTDIDAHNRFWTTQFDARPLQVGTLRGVTIPGLVVLFRHRLPTGPSEGSVINHLGLKLRSLSEFTARFDRDGYSYLPPRSGRENTPQTYVTGPDGFRMELVEDPRIPAAAISHHLHYWLEHPVDVKRWYVRTLLVKPTMRGPYESGDVPGMNLTMATLGTQPVPGVPTKGRLLDSFGFDVANLQTYANALAATGAALDSPYRRDPELGLNTVVLTDPWGATIRLTEGLGQIAGRTPYAHMDGYVVSRPVE